MEGNEAQPHIPTSPPPVHASHPGDEAASLMQIVVMEQVHK